MKKSYRKSNIINIVLKDARGWMGPVTEGPEGLKDGEEKFPVNKNKDYNGIIGEDTIQQVSDARKRQ